MNTISLACPEKSPVPIKVTRYPDGQQNLSVSPDAPIGHYTVASRMRDFKDLELIALAKRAVDGLGCSTFTELYVPYFLGARSDRRFEDGGVRYLSEIVAPMVNALGFDRVTVADPHSDVLENVVHNVRITPLQDVFARRLAAFGDPVLVVPDAGASKRVHAVAKAMGVSKVLHCSKDREVLTGRITKTTVPPIPEGYAGPFVVLDDICDGGKTFTELADALQPELPAGSRLHLVVTHGIFSKAVSFAQLCVQYASITTTNSYRDFTADEYEVAKLYGCELIQVELL